MFYLYLKINIPACYLVVVKRDNADLADANLAANAPSRKPDPAKPMSDQDVADIVFDLIVKSESDALERHEQTNLSTKAISSGTEAAVSTAQFAALAGGTAGMLPAARGLGGLAAAGASTGVAGSLMQGSRIAAGDAPPGVS